MAAGIRLDFLLNAAPGSDLIETSGFVMDGLNCRVRALFRYWDSLWMISVFSPTGSGIVQGAAALDGEDMFGNVVVTGRPPGKLLIVDTLGKNRNPGLNDWRAGVWMVYVPAVLL